MDPITPETPAGHRPAKTHTFKMRLTADDAAKLKSAAHENELSQADYVRFMVFARTSYAPPNSSKLEEVARQLAAIGNNLNQSQKSINEAQASGTLTADQFNAMHSAILTGLKAWADPLSDLRSELKKIRPTG